MWRYDRNALSTARSHWYRGAPLAPTRLAVLIHYPPCKACHTFSGVRGVSVWRTPACDSASITALAMATGAASVGNSPIPLAPRGFVGDSVSTVSRVNAGVVLALGRV